MKMILPAIALCTVLAVGATTSAEAMCGSCAPVCNTCAPRPVFRPMERVCTTRSCCDPCDSGSSFNILNPFTYFG